jgi:RNA polymerase sigma-32 factor
MQAIDDGDLSPENVTKIATRLDVAEFEVVNMNRRLSGGDQSLNAPVRIDGDGEWQDWLVDDKQKSQETVVADQQEMDVRRAMLIEAMDGLNDREKNIIVERRLKESPSTLEDLSKVYEISRERVRQIEVRAFEKLQKSMRNMAIDQSLALPSQ